MTQIMTHRHKYMQLTSTLWDFNNTALGRHYFAIKMYVSFFRGCGTFVCTLVVNRNMSRKSFNKIWASANTTASFTLCSSD